MSESKCGLRHPARCIHLYKADGTCGLKESCWYGLPAEPENRPTCPKCKRELHALFPHGNCKWICEQGICDYTQPDSDQRPPMPAAREGYHAGEWRAVKTGDRWFYSSNGKIGPTLCEGESIIGKRWIAVPDAKPEPALEAAKVYSETHSTNGNAKASEPVVRYWRHVTWRDEWCKTENDIITENVAESRQYIGQKLVVNVWNVVTQAEYARAGYAKHPVKTVDPIEPIGSLIEHSYAALFDKACELIIKHVNVVQERMAKVEGK